MIVLATKEHPDCRQPNPHRKAPKIKSKQKMVVVGINKEINKEILFGKSYVKSLTTGHRGTPARVTAESVFELTQAEMKGIGEIIDFGPEPPTEEMVNYFLWQRDASLCSPSEKLLNPLDRSKTVLYTNLDSFNVFNFEVCVRRMGILCRDRIRRSEKQKAEVASDPTEDKRKMLDQINREVSIHRAYVQANPVDGWKGMRPPTVRELLVDQVLSDDHSPTPYDDFSSWSQDSTDLDNYHRAMSLHRRIDKTPKADARILADVLTKRMSNTIDELPWSYEDEGQVKATDLDQYGTPINDPDYLRDDILLRDTSCKPNTNTITKGRRVPGIPVGDHIPKNPSKLHKHNVKRGWMAHDGFCDPVVTSQPRSKSLYTPTLSNSKIAQIASESLSRPLSQTPTTTVHNFSIWYKNYGSEEARHILSTFESRYTYFLDRLLKKPNNEDSILGLSSYSHYRAGISAHLQNDDLKLHKIRAYNVHVERSNPAYQKWLLDHRQSIYKPFKHSDFAGNNYKSNNFTQFHKEYNAQYWRWQNEVISFEQFIGNTKILQEQDIYRTYVIHELKAIYRRERLDREKYEKNLPVPVGKATGPLNLPLDLSNLKEMSEEEYNKITAKNYVYVPDSKEVDKSTNYYDDYCDEILYDSHVKLYRRRVFTTLNAGYNRPVTEIIRPSFNNINSTHLDIKIINLVQMKDCGRITTKQFNNQVYKEFYTEYLVPLLVSIAK